LQCSARLPRQAVQDGLTERNPGWLDLAATSLPDGDADLESAAFASFDVPPCPQCGGVLKPDVVFFGESVPQDRVASVRTALAAADAVLVVGSSLMVYSGYRFVEDAVAAGKPVWAVNRGRTRADGLLAGKLEADVGETLQAVVEAYRSTPTRNTRSATDSKLQAAAM
jgi:NAD-dependent SIR2 family protein deacetylase